jgi:hypothetical protein
VSPKRTTAPDGVRGAISPPAARPVKQHTAPERRITPGRAARVGLELARERRHLHHRPTIAQLRTMARFEGSRPCSYRLDPEVNWLPESLPLDFPHGTDGLCFCHGGGELVVLPDGGGFALI